MSRKRILKSRDKVRVEFWPVKLEANGIGLIVLPLALLIVLVMILTIALTVPKAIDAWVNRSVEQTNPAVLERPPA